ncbi:mucin-19-like, partial [Corapipo altera]|uniref:mucin-19-like n=1 Tax=Corapipo altera TaxID=415028 RepID=UPI000FD6A375
MGVPWVLGGVPWVPRGSVGSGGGPDPPPPPPGDPPRCPFAAPPPPPTPPPLPPDCDPQEGGGASDVTEERLRATSCGGDTAGGATETPGVATETPRGATGTPGGDTGGAAPGGDNLVMEGTEGPGATNCSGDTLGHAREVCEGATTPVAAVPTSPGSDSLMVAHGGDVVMEGTDQPGVTNDPGDTKGHLNEVYGGATTPVGLVTTSPGGDKVLVATASDVIAEGTEELGVTGDPRDTLGRVTEVYGGATTPVAPVPTSPGRDTVAVAHGGSDVIVEGTDQPGVTGDPGDTLGHLNEVYGGATTLVGLVPTPPGGDKVLVATGSDVIVEGTEEPGVTGDPGDTLGHLNEVYEDATTPVAPVPTSPGSDKVLVATGGDEVTEGTDQPEVTGDPGDTLGHVNEVYEDTTTPVAPVTPPQGGDKVLVATGSDVIVEGTQEPGVTGDPRGTLGHVNEVYGDATTPVGLVPTSPGGDKVLVAHGGDVVTEGTDQPGDPSDPEGHVTTVVAPVTPPPGGVLVATGVGTDRLDVTEQPGDTLGRVTEVYGGATTPVAAVPTSPGGDTMPVPHGGDVVLEGTESPRVPNCPGATSGRATAAPRGATTSAPPVVATSPRGDTVMVAPGGDIALGGSGVPNCSGDAPGVPRDATSTPPPAVATSPRGDTVMVAPGGDIALGGTEGPGATEMSPRGGGDKAGVALEGTSHPLGDPPCPAPTPTPADIAPPPTRCAPPPPRPAPNVFP